MLNKICFRYGRVLLLFCISFVFLCTTVSAVEEQKDASITKAKVTGMIFGNVVDEEGSAVESAKIVCTGKGKKKNTSSDSDGSFKINGLKAGKYKIQATKKGYKKSKQQKITLQSGKSEEIEIILQQKGGNKDTTPPTVTITSPENGESISGTIEVLAEASDNVAVEKIEFYVDDKIEDTDTTSPYSFSFDASTVNEGVHTIMAKAFDTSNNSTIIEITVTIVHPPVFPGIVLLYSVNTDTAHVAWLPASDDATPASNLKYEIYISTEYDFMPSSSNLYASYTAETEAELSGLVKETDYYILILAVDEENNKSTERDYRSVRTASDSPVMNGAVTVYDTESSGMKLSTINDDEYVFEKTDETSLPEEGNIIYGEDGEYLRKVESIETVGNTVTMKTAQATLSDVYERANLSAEVTLFDVSETAEAGSKSPSSGLSFTSQRNKNNVPIARGVEWKSGILKANQLDFVQSLQSGSGKSTYTYETKEGLTLTIESKFEPKFATDFEYDAGIKKAEVSAKGTFQLTIDSEYKLKNSGAFEYEKKLLKRTYTTIYYIGTVPVYQKITLSLELLLSGKISSEITASASASTTIDVNIGIKYDPDNGKWTSSNSTSKSESMEASLKLAGGVNAEVRLVPNIELKYYTIVANNLSVEPYLNGNIAAESVSTVDVLTGDYLSVSQPTAFDFNLGVEGYISGNLDFLGKKYTIYEKTKIFGPLETELFSLPKLSLSEVGVDEKKKQLKATVSDGTNNSFDKSSIAWKVYPSDSGELVVDKSDPFSATFTPNESTECSIFFSGYSALGALSRQYEKLEIKGSSIYVDAAKGNDFTGNGSQEKPFNTISMGVSMAVDGSTIVVAEGVYNETVYITDSDINLLGAGSGKSDIKSGIYVKGHKVTISGFSITGDYGIELTDSEAMITSNEIYDCTYSGIGAFFSKSVLTITSNKIYGNYVGIGVESNSTATISSNEISDNNYAGIAVSSNSSVTMTTNKIYNNNKDYSGYGIIIYVASAIIKSNEIYDNSGSGICITANS